MNHATHSIYLILTMMCSFAACVPESTPQKTRTHVTPHDSFAAPASWQQQNRGKHTHKDKDVHLATANVSIKPYATPPALSETIRVLSAHNTLFTLHKNHQGLHLKSLAPHDIWKNLSLPALHEGDHELDTYSLVEFGDNALLLVHTPSTTSIRLWDSGWRGAQRSSWISYDMGQSWTRFLGPWSQDSGEALLARHHHGVSYVWENNPKSPSSVRLWSNSSGMSWDLVHDKAFMIIDYLPLPQALLHSTHYGYIERSEDDGVTWQHVQGPAGNRPPSLSSTKKHTFASADNGVWISDSIQAHTWKPLMTHAISAMVAKDHTLVVAQAKSGDVTKVLLGEPPKTSTYIALPTLPPARYMALRLINEHIIAIQDNAHILRLNLQEDRWTNITPKPSRTYKVLPYQDKIYALDDQGYTQVWDPTSTSWKKFLRRTFNIQRVQDLLVILTKTHHTYTHIFLLDGEHTRLLPSPFLKKAPVLLNAQTQLMKRGNTLYMYTPHHVHTSQHVHASQHMHTPYTPPPLLTLDLTQDQDTWRVLDGLPATHFDAISINQTGIFLSTDEGILAQTTPKETRVFEKLPFCANASELEAVSWKHQPYLLCAQKLYTRDAHTQIWRPVPLGFVQGQGAHIFVHNTGLYMQRADDTIWHIQEDTDTLIFSSPTRISSMHPTDTGFLVHTHTQDIFLIQL